MKLTAVWDEHTAGGCAKYDTWFASPQFELKHTKPNATLNLTLTQSIEASSNAMHNIGFWIMPSPGHNQRIRQFDKKLVVQKTKYKTREVSLNLSLPNDSPNPYIVCCTTFDPGLFATFTLTLSSADDPEATITMLPPPEEEVTIKAAAPAPPPAAPPPAEEAPPRRADAFDPVYHRQGQGVPAAQVAETTSRIAALLARLPAGSMFEDAEFGATAASLGSADWNEAAKVTSWKRPSQISGGAARLFEEGSSKQGIILGLPGTAWAMGALNLIAADADEASKLFIDASHFDQGLLSVRMLTDEPGAASPWRCVIVDDRIPCGSNGAPCFARAADPSAFWVSIVEKALAKVAGSFEKLTRPLDSSNSLQALGMLSGGAPRQVNLPPAGGDADAAWNALQASWDTPHLKGVILDGSTDAMRNKAAEAAARGIMANRPYCLLTSCTVAGIGRMVKLRGFYGELEWNGKWSDRDPSWTNQLRSFLNYSNASDGSFFISFDDLCSNFSHLLLVSAADSQSACARVDASWATAAGPRTVSWRANHQWLLHVTRQCSITIEVTQTDGSEPAGFLVMRSNQGVDSNRRKLWVDECDVVHHLEPAGTTLNASTFQIAPSVGSKPYVVVPYRVQPDAPESYFTLTVYAHADDFGELPFKLDHISPDVDWHTARLEASWSDVVALDETDGNYSPGVQLHLQLEGEGPASAIVYLDTDSSCPPYSMALVKNVGTAGLTIDRLPLNPQVVSKHRPDGLSFFEEFDSGNEGHMIVPFMETRPATAPMKPFSVIVYSDHPVKLARASNGEWVCEFCRRGQCPYGHLLEKMAIVEWHLDMRCAAADELLAKCA